MPRHGPGFSAALAGTARSPLSSPATRRPPVIPGLSPHLARLPGNPVLPETAWEFKQTFGYCRLLLSRYYCQVFFTDPRKIASKAPAETLLPRPFHKHRTFRRTAPSSAKHTSIRNSRPRLRIATCTSSSLGTKSSSHTLAVENSTGIFYSAGPPAAKQGLGSSRKMRGSRAAASACSELHALRHLVRGWFKAAGTAPHFAIHGIRSPPARTTLCHRTGL